MTHELMPLDQALALADHASPMPADAHRALLVLRERITVLEKSTTSQLVQQHPDDDAVDRFAIAMKAKLAAARAKGRSGWNNNELGMQQRLSDMLQEHVVKGDPVDVANFCLFLHLRHERILPQRPPVAAQRAAARWSALREMDGGAIYRLLGDVDGMHPEQADHAMDLYLETRESLRAALSGDADTTCPEATP